MESFRSHWKSPSNIALVKYWGKKPVQLPRNPSISFTLSVCHTETSVEAAPSAGDARISILMDGEEVPSFVPKIEAFLQRIEPVIPEIKGLDFTIRTHNTFPHSSGIASSASGMSALALCFFDIALQRGRPVADFRTVSELARLGSGSACRSVYGPIAVWGEHPDFKDSSDNYAIPFKNHHTIFSTYRDAILIVDQGVKKVSSSAGHQMIDGHPFAEARFDQARKNMTRIREILVAGEVGDFADLVEYEALTLHALMMSSNPGYVLMKPGTLEVMDRVRAFRQESKAPLCFTLDAGANVHLLYPEEINEQVERFIETELKQFCSGGYYICDHVGPGPELIKE